MGGSQFQLVEKRRRVPDLGAVDMRIRPLLERMLQPDPALRPTMAEVASWTPTGLARTSTAPLSGFDPLARPESAVQVQQDRAPSTAPRRRALWLGVSVAAVLLVLGGGGYVLFELVWSAPGAPPTLPPPPKLAQERCRRRRSNLRPSPNVRSR